MTISAAMHRRIIQKNLLEIKRHATCERMDVDSAGSKAMMLLEIGETNVAIKADAEVTGKL